VSVPRPYRSEPLAAARTRWRLDWLIRPTSASPREGAGPLQPQHAHSLDNLPPPLLPAPSPPPTGGTTRILVGPAVDNPHTKGDRARRRPAAGDDGQPPILEFPDESANPAAGAAAHGGASSDGGLTAMVAAFIFLSLGLTRWLRVGTERRPRLLRAGRRERPG
jgi:hypothetical protein